MKIIDGKGIVLGRLASYVAKEALKGEEFAIVNCEEILITGNKKTTQREFFEKRSRFGQSQKGPKHPAMSIKIVKRTIRGMVPNFRVGRGREAFKRIKCYVGVPPEFQGKEIIELEKRRRIKTSKVKEFTRE